MSGGAFIDRFGAADILFVCGAILVVTSGAFPFLTADETVLPNDSDTEINTVLDETNGDLTDEGVLGEIDGELTDEIRGINAADWNLLAGVALIGGLVVGLRRWNTTTVSVAIVSTTIVVLVPLLYINDPVRAFDEPFQSTARPLVSVGTGAYIALLGGLLQAGGIVGGCRHTLVSKQPSDRLTTLLRRPFDGDRSQQATRQSLDNEGTATRRSVGDGGSTTHQPPGDTPSGESESTRRQFQDHKRHSQTDSEGQSHQPQQRSAGEQTLTESYIRSSASPDGKWIVELPVGLSVHESSSSTQIPTIDAVCFTSQDPALPETYPDGPWHFLEPMDYDSNISKTDIFRRMQNVGSLHSETVSIVEVKTGKPSFGTIGQLEAYATLLETEYGLTVDERILISPKRDPVVDHVCCKRGIRVVNAN